MVLAGVGAVVDFVGAGVEGTGRDLVQQGFPDVGQAGIDQGNAGFVFLAQFVAQPGDQFQAAGATADNYDVMQVFHNDRLEVKRAKRSFGEKRLAVLTDFVQSLTGGG